MKRRLLSIVTVLSMCLSLCPTWALAAEADPSLCKHPPAHTGDCGCVAPTGGQPCGHTHTAECYALGVLPCTDSGGPYEVGADTENPLDCQHTHDEDCGYITPIEGTPEEPEVPLPARMRAVARASDINMITNFVFAQGVPIVIKQNGDMTSVYSVDGELLSGDTDVSGYSIYGGWFDGDNEHTADTSVTVESGAISELFGGSFSGTLTGNTSVVVNGGEITNVVCGGGNQSVINGNTTVAVKGGTIGVDGNGDVGFVYGGGFNSKVTGSTAITIDSGTTIYMTVYGGSNRESVENTRIIMNGGSVGYICGGGYAGAVTGSASVEIRGGTINMQVFGGGGSDSAVYGGTNVNVHGGTVGSVFGGGDYGTVAGGTSVAIGGTAQVIGNVFGGGSGQNAPADDSRVEIAGGTMTTVFGGGDQGAVTGNAVVTVSGGEIKDSVYGGGNEAAVKNARLVFDGGAANQIYGGGFGSGSAVETSCVELKRGVCDNVYGGGRNPGSTVEQTTITLGADWGYTKQVFAGGSFSAVTNASRVIVQNYETKSEQSDFLFINAETAGDSEVVIRRDEGGPSGSANTSKFNLTPIGVKKIVVEYGEVTLLGRNGLDLQLDSLDIQANGQVRFQDWDTAVIQKLSGSGGQLLFPAQFLSGTTEIVNRPVTVGEISAAAPLIIKAEGTGWGTNLENFYFFHGAGIDVLTSANCFFSEGYEVVLREIPGKDGAKGVYLQQKEAEKPVYISKLEFNQNPVAYNGTITLTVGVGVQLTTADYLELIPNARIQIRGSNDRNVLFADIQVNEDGTSATVTGVDGVTSPAQVDGAYITITLPVNADLLNTCQEGLSMIATAPNQYSSTAHLVGPNNETRIDITPTPITLTQTIPDPDSQDPLEGELEDGTFYTAGFRWHSEEGSAASAFVPDRDYQADIILTPKEGHWLSAASIGNTVIYDGKTVSCVFNADGTATLKNVKSVRFAGYRIVAAVSPAAGGTVAGGGIYTDNTSVTVTAMANSGYRFVKWTEGGSEVSGSANYTFTVTGNRTLIAVFEKDTLPQPTTYTVTVQTEGSGTASASPASATAGTTITLTAAPDSGYHFKEWQVISGGVTISGDNFTMPDANVTVKAVFEPDSTPPQPTTYTVTVQTEGGGTASASPASATAGTTITLTAAPDSGYHFKEWQVISGGVTISGGSFTMPDANVTVKAVFEPDSTPPQPMIYTVTVQTEGSGTASASPASATAGTTITLTAAPDSGYHFKEWQVISGGVTISGDSFTMPDANVTVKAVFEPDPILPQPETETKLEITDGISEVPPAFKELEHLNTPEKIVQAMRTAITQTGVPSGNLAVYDVALLVSTDSGATWTPATKDNFPSGGLTITLPYPEGTDSSYQFTVVHMFTTSDFGKQPGDTEVFTPDTVKNTAQGIQVSVTGLSPFSVGWTAPATNPATPPFGYGGGWIVSTYAVTVEKPEHGKVAASRANASNGSTVTLTVTPDSGYVLDTLTVTDSQGNEIRLTAQGNGKYTFTMPGRDVTVRASFAPLPEDVEQPCDGGAACPSRGFTDLGAVGTWYHEAVDYALQNGLMGGYRNGLFGPDAPLTRAQLAQILYNKEGGPAVTGSGTFTDVAPGAWYAPAVAWAAARGIAGGYGDGRFGPSDSITREQLAVMLWRYAGSPAATDKELHFTDGDKASGYALDALHWALENDIISGKGGGILDPKGLATRAQAAQMLKNFLES